MRLKFRHDRVLLRLYRSSLAVRREAWRIGDRRRALPPGR